MTLKQLKALYWVTKLGSFSKAADKLHTTQSTISSRIQQLEMSLGVLLLDRGQYKAQPTARGRELFNMAERVLTISAQIQETIGDPRALSGIIRVGVAEFVALDWLPQWVAAAHKHYPRVQLEMDVDLTQGLNEKLASGQIDLALIPGPINSPGLRQYTLGTVQFAWMASPALQVPTDPIRSTDLHRFPILLLSNQSNLHSILRSWFENEGSRPSQVNFCNNLATLASLTIAGLGVAYLPVNYHRNDLEEGRLQVIDARPALSPLEYVCAHHSDMTEPLVPLLSKLAVEVSTFLSPNAEQAE